MATDTQRVQRAYEVFLKLKDQYLIGLKIQSQILNFEF